LEQNKKQILKVENLSVSYGSIRALKEVNLELFEGEIVVLVGANGAGKTTLLETILGSTKCESGDIVYQSNSIKSLPADKIVRAGITLVPEGRGVFAAMSVQDNLLLGAHHNLKDSAAKLAKVYEHFPILKERKDQIARTLSGGERQMLAIGRSLMGSPKLILVDEPSIGLAPIIVNEIFEILVGLNKEGYTILLSEQNAYKALKIANRGYVLETGKVVLSGTSVQLLNDPGVREAYLGA